MHIWHKLKFSFKLILIIALTLVGYCTLIIGLGVMNSLNHQQWEPEEGVWFCSELQIQISFDENANSYAVLENDTVLCATGYEKNSRYVTVGIQEENVNGYELGESIFFGQFVCRSENEFILKEVSSGVEYIFKRIR